MDLQSIRTGLRGRFPRVAAGYRELKEATRMLVYGRRHVADTFTTIHRKRLWGSTESVSGPGSLLAATAAVRSELPILLKSIGATSLLDAPCGDFAWMSKTPLQLERYIGVDIVAELIHDNRNRYGAPTREFMVGDVTRDELPRVDIILARDYFIHLSNAYIKASLANFRRTGSTYLLTTTYTEISRNQNVATGSWRPINLELSPFNFPPPQQLIREDGEFGRSLGLWRLTDL